MIPFTLVTEENANMHFGYELRNGNASTDIEKYQRQSEDDRCLLVGTEGYGRQTYWHQNNTLLNRTRIIWYMKYNIGHVSTWQTLQKSWEQCILRVSIITMYQGLGILNWYTVLQNKTSATNSLKLNKEYFTHYGTNNTENILLRATEENIYVDSNIHHWLSLKCLVWSQTEPLYWFIDSQWKSHTWYLLLEDVPLSTCVFATWWPSTLFST